MRFCGLSLADQVPAAETLWACARAAATFEPLVKPLDQAVRGAGLIAPRPSFDSRAARRMIGLLPLMGGQIIHASLVAAPGQHHADAAREARKAGKSAAGIWPDEPAKAVLQDTDARPPRPAGRVPFRHRMKGLLAFDGRTPPAARPPTQPTLPKRTVRANAKNAKHRARLEHVFAQEKDRLGLFSRSIGAKRAKATPAMANIACNLGRWRSREGRLASACRRYGEEPHSNRPKPANQPTSRY